MMMCFEEDHSGLYDLNINGYNLVMTCSACPEQYDVFDENRKQVAYFRLRHGVFSAECPDVFGEQVYRSSPKGDGIFFPEERLRELTVAIEKVDEWVKRNHNGQGKRVDSNCG